MSMCYLHVLALCASDQSMLILALKPDDPAQDYQVQRMDGWMNG